MPKLQQPALFLSSSSSATGQILRIVTQNLRPNRVKCTDTLEFAIQVPKLLAIGARLHGVARHTPICSYFSPNFSRRELIARKMRLCLHYAKAAQFVRRNRRFILFYMYIFLLQVQADVAFSIATFINRISLERISDFIRVFESLRRQRIAAFRQYEIRPRFTR
jgi:hypothetical protein